MTNNRLRGLGWIPDVPDFRDYSLTANDLRAAGQGAPEASDLRSAMPRIWDQIDSSACTGFAGAAVNWHRQYVQGKECFEPSPLFIYYNARLLAGYAKYDIGSTIRDTMKSMGRWGVCREESWPFQTSAVTKAPTKTRYREAERHQSKIYRRVERDIDAMRICLSNDRPIVFGFAVYSSFASAEVEASGYAPMPQKGETMLGGHAAVKVGHIDSEEVFICRNSWSPDWGDGGYFYLPYGYAKDANLSDDFWTLDLVE